MKTISSFFEHKRSIGGLILLVALIANTYNIQENSVRIKHLTNFESGIQTCFTRVNQTYTASLLNDTTSNYLSQNFQNLTEECFAEGILNIEESFKVELSLVAKKLTTLASNVHWFHEDILSPGATRAISKDSESRDVGARFEKIENTKDAILESSEKYKNEITNSLNSEKTIFYVSAVLLAIMMLSEFMKNARHRLSNNIFEKNASKELLDNGGGASVKVADIIKSALEQNNLVNCSKLFSNYHAYQALDKKNKDKTGLEGLITPITAKSSNEISEKINEVWEDDSIGITADTNEGKMLHDLNLEQMSSAVIDLLAEKLFSKGIQLDIQIPENLMVKARSEELEQAMYYLINFAVNSSQSINGENNISIYAHRLGDIVAFDLIHTGTGLDAEILKRRAGITNSTKELDIDLKICQTFFEEMGAKFQLDNKIGQNGEVIGTRIKIIFKAGSNSTARLIDVKVGSKREILAAMDHKEIF